MKHKTGQLVINKKFGLGKVLALDGDSVTVFFKDQSDNPRTINVGVVPLEIPEKQTDPWLDNLDLSVAATGTAKQYMTHGRAVEKFLGYFPNGFYDPEYLKEERDHKVAAHNLWRENLGKDVYRKLLDADDYPEIVRRALQVEGKTILLAIQEKAALRQAVTEPRDVKAFAVGLFDLIYGDAQFEHRFARFTEVLDALPQPKTPLRWTVQTIFPFIALPEKHMFLKPEATKDAAERRAFSLNYQPQPNWLTYTCLLNFGEILMADLADLKPRDMIDIQSFIFVTRDSSYE